MNSNTWQSTYARHRVWFVLASIVVLVLVLMIYRRPDQFLHPYIWVEDGTDNLPDYVQAGWLSLFHPLVGYFILPVKLIFALSATLSFRWFPEISY